MSNIKGKHVNPHNYGWKAGMSAPLDPHHRKPKKRGGAGGHCCGCETKTLTLSIKKMSAGQGGPADTILFKPKNGKIMIMNAPIKVRRKKKGRVGGTY